MLSIRAFDTETTGLTPPIAVAELSFARIIEVVPGMSYHIEDCFTMLVDPERPMEPEASEKNGIYDKDIEREKPPPLRDIKLPQDPCYFVAHNVPFDYPLLKNHINVIGTLCTLQMARRFSPKAPTHQLQDLIEWLGISENPTHWAEDDTMACAELLVHYLVTLGWGFMKMYDYLQQPFEYKEMIWGKHRGLAMSDVPTGYLFFLDELELDVDMRHTVNQQLKYRGLR